jgi:hypothetical protein
MLEKLTIARCREVAATARKALATIGVTLPRHTDLGRQIEDTEWMATFPADPLDEIAGAYATDPERATRAFLSFPQFQDVVGGLYHARRAVAAKPDIVHALRKRFDRLQTVSAAAQNHLFELQVAGRLSIRRRGVRFDEPDLTAPFSRFGRLGLACKRAQNIARVKERIGGGADQIVRTGRNGVIVIDVQPLLFPPSPDDGRPICQFYQREAQFVDDLATRVDARAAVMSAEISKARATTNVLGVVFAVTGWGLVEVDGLVAQLFAWVVRAPGGSTAAERAVVTALRSAPTSWERARAAVAA